MPQSPHTVSPKVARPVLVLTGGGSGGHITPLLSLAHALKTADPECKIIYIGHKGDRFDRLKEHYHDFDEVGFVNAGKFRRYWGESTLRRLTDLRTLALNVRDSFRLFSSIPAAYRILRKVKPAVIFSKGGFVAVPVGVAAKIRGIPIVTHDSDAIPGLANRIVGRWAKLHTTAMPADFYNYPKDSTRQVGIPIDERIHRVNEHMQREFKQQIGVSSNADVLLISGGGLGSRNISEKVLDIAPKLLADYPKLRIVHFTGQKAEAEIRSKYHDLLAPAQRGRVEAIGFSGDFYKYVGAADLIVSRAGATSLAEFAVAAKACILIPSPFLTGGHQIKNAEELAKIGAVEIVENDAPATELQIKVAQLLDNSAKRQSLANKLAATAKHDAAAKLAEILLDVAAKKG